MAQDHDRHHDHTVLQMLVRPGESVALAQRSTQETFGWDKNEARGALQALKARLSELQHMLYAEGRHGLLIVLQAMDAGGKDGTIRHVMTGFNPAGVRVHSFKAPAGDEVVHDYLWRVHAACPARGQIAVFNRSHYEDVLVVRVKGLAPESRWRRRYHHIREFERMLVEEGTHIVKLHLQISPDEQRKRLQDRLDDPHERWKFRAGDLDDRVLWGDYVAAYEEAIEETTAPHAPWYVVPADRRWVRDLAVARIVLDALEKLDPQLPEPLPELAGTTVV